MATVFSPALIRTLMRVVLIVLVFVFSLGVFLFLQATAGEVEKADEDRSRVRVPVFVATKVDVQRQWSGQGLAEALDTADIPARVTATIDAIEPCVLVGERIEQGQLLFKLDPSDYERQVVQQQNTLASIAAEIDLLDVEQQGLADRLKLAEEDAALAKDEADRVSQLFSRGAAGQQDMDLTRRQAIAAAQTVIQLRENLEKIPARRAQLEARRDAQEAQLKLSQLNLERTAIASPIPGVIAEVDVEVGENVTPGMRLARVVNLEQIEVTINLPSAARQSVSIGNAMKLTSVSDMNRTWEGQVQRIAPTDSQTSRSMKVYVMVNQSKQIQRYFEGDKSASLKILTPGTFLAGTVTSATREQRFVVPARAIRAGKIHVIADGLIETRKVEPLYNVESSYSEIGLPDEQWVVIGDEGLVPGQLVTVNMSTTILDGESVDAVLPDGTLLEAVPQKTAVESGEQEAGAPS